jgi:hypothetical protein
MVPSVPNLNRATVDVRLGCGIEVSFDVRISCEAGVGSFVTGGYLDVARPIG